MPTKETSKLRYLAISDPDNQKTKLVAAIDDETITKEDFLTSFEKVIKFVKKIEEGYLQVVIQLRTILEQELQQTRRETKEALQSTLDTWTKDKDRQIARRLISLRDGEDGEDADENAIYERLVTKIKVPSLGEIMQSLPPVTVDSVEGLMERLEELKKAQQVEAAPNRFYGPSKIYKALANVVPTGTPNGVLTTFTLSKAPTKDTEKVYINGVRQQSGASNDYTLNAYTITFVTAPPTGAKILVDFEYN